jgi:exodeoxyribonuclease VII small subunit
MALEKESIDYEEALRRLREIVEEVKKKELSLEKSLDLLDEGVQLAAICVERIDHTRWQEEGIVGVETEDGSEKESPVS